MVNDLIGRFRNADITIIEAAIENNHAYLLTRRKQFSDQNCKTRTNIPELAGTHILDATVLQRLYRRNRRKTVRVLSGENSAKCKITVDTIKEHFQHPCDNYERHRVMDSITVPTPETRVQAE